jgi:ABC-2 type transport system ATP-binding protein
MLKFTDLKRFTDRLAKFLSGGMKQKLGLACAMMGKPEILILDEPTVGVDPISRRELWQMCQDLMSEQHTVIWSTSYLDEAQQCDRVILLHEGQVRFSGQPQAFYECVENKVFQFEPQSGIREALEKTLTKPHVVDAVIQGKNIRVVLESAEYQSEFKHLKATPPRFEDAFVYQLEGKFARTSVLSDYLKSKPKSNVLPIEAVDLTKKFGDFTATENISFKINQGEIFGLLGPNGAGKSTTFKMLCGLVTPTSGQALVSGISLSTSSSDARNHIGYMAQKFSLYSDLSVIQNLEFFAGIYGLKLQHKRRIIKEMLSIFDLQHFRNTTTGLLSLGYKQRLALACAIMHDPDVLFLDEPTSGVDPLTRREFWTHINGLVRKGITIMITTHFMDEAEYCDTISLIYRGKNIATNTPTHLKALVQSANLPNPTLEDAFIELINTSERGVAIQ